MSLISTFSTPGTERSGASAPLLTSCQQAARLVEALFAVTAPAHWDRLLDLRQALLEGAESRQWLPLFLECRRVLEEDHYLPFYRLRRLLLPGATPTSGLLDLAQAR